MTTESTVDPTKLADERDRNELNFARDEQMREAIFCTIRDYRQPDKLRAGDRVPNLELPRLDGWGSVKLGAARRIPLVLIFGSYT